MIQIYKAGNEQFDMNGDHVLQCISCTLEARLNGTWQMILEHPIDADGIFKDIQTGAVIKAPTFMPEDQLFRIYSTTKEDDLVTAYARPIFFDSAHDVFLIDTRPTEKNGQQALDTMMTGTKYSGNSDIIGTSTAYYIRKNLIEAIASNDENSFLNRWGGEILYDNYTIHVNSVAGGDYGARAEFAYNLEGIKEDVNMDEVITRIIPVSYNGYTLVGNQPWVDSPLIDKYPIIYCKEVKFDDVKLQADCQEDEDGFLTIEKLREELISRSQKMYSDEQVDKPIINYSCELALLANTDEYKDVAELEHIGLGDIVQCENRRLGITTQSRSIYLKYDCIFEKVTKVEIGAFKDIFFNDLSGTIQKVENAIRPDGTIVAEEIRGFINAMEASLKLQSTAAKKVDGRAFLIEDLDKTSGLFGAMEAGTQGLRISKRRTADDRAWVWTTAITALGIIADTIVTGSLTSKNWKKDETGFRLNLDEGTINSKHLRLDVAGLLTVYKALISGGEITITTPSGKNVLRVNEDEFVVGSNDKGLHWDAGTGLFSLYKALISGGEITIKDTAGNRIFRVSESEGFVFGDGENGIIRYDIADKLLKMYKDITLYGSITNYSSSGKKSIQIGDNQLKVYSWQTDGNWIGGIGSLVTENGKNYMALYCDQGDQITISYFNGTTSEDGAQKYGNFMRFDHRQLNNDPLDYNQERAIKLAETPSIVNNPNGYFWVGPSKIHMRSGIIVKTEFGKVLSGTFKTGAGETVTLDHGAVVSVE